MKQMIVHIEPKLTQMALLEEGKLVEFAAERSQGHSLVGSFYKGRVVNVLPGMQAAFVDIGQKKNAFLYVDDVLHPHLEKQPKDKPNIESLLRVGQEIVVQVMKEPLGGKGPRVTTHYSLPGRWIVYMPHADYVAVSKKVYREHDRNRLKVLGDSLRRSGEGVIMRTVSEDEHPDAIEGDLNALRERWLSIQEKADACAAPCLLHRDLSIVQRFIRDVFDPEQDELWIDSRPEAREAELFLEEIAHGGHRPVRMHQGHEHIFRAHGVQEQLERDFARRVTLESGGTIVLDQTEALTVVDVNTAKYTGGGNLEETVTKTNLQAAEEIARLIRLRDIGGIIIVDFIDMEEEKNRQEVVNRLEAGMSRDRTKSHVVGWSKLGLLELTRKKVREDTAVMFSKSCEVCGGTGKINLLSAH
ncbi:Rne/Rng family ribonuclease [Paenibacillus cellulositrophicus]|jgi:ribonuclease G|uniref:Ribonuclease E/G n=3 Tax=Paenibacillus TaxID=44249 RepID=A0A1R1EF22_9BACL|nr:MULTISPECIES: Rne/Rng family ribonuclease [Paenibacillus]MEC0176006.1 Rne/Rng family ribonuclease [Paenibacillus favisporus]OMF50433.1 ribonuclease E/G [Paenibacillus rhizosphaerae]OXL85178.1 ribonuclease [Paenibacillus sp. SSG-1]RED31750.1 ribonuclease G [Paenibacillus sp. VMFN-D1]UYO07121.1 Rne/Rng family ribonuclease [Paenibacillus sp. PSB04]